MCREDETWRQEYWRKFAASFSTKPSEWRHEEERRLILYSHMLRFDDQESRKLKYRFADLVGIIFGIKTTSEDKLQIMRIIGQKCAAENRQDFEFYQAYYSNRTKRIELAPLTTARSGRFHFVPAETPPALSQAPKLSCGNSRSSTFSPRRARESPPEPQAQIGPSDLRPAGSVPDRMNKTPPSAFC